ncbi:unnamed protein product, partial [Mesorhabditis spiculigera]
MNMVLSLALFFSLFSAIQAFACPNGTISIPGQHLCVVPVPQAANYNNAIRECDRLGGGVVKIESVFENAILFGILESSFNGSAAYIGVEKSANGKWVYSDGSPLNYTNWAAGQPSTGYCAQIDPSSTKWKSLDCSTSLPYFCGVDGNKFQCPDGWVYSPDTDFCYYLQNFTTPDSIHWQLYNWTTAELNCQKMGSHLASIHSKAENNFIFNLIYYRGPTSSNASPNNCDYSRAWIGLYGNAQIGNSNLWSDGTFIDFRDPSTSAITSAQYWAAHSGACLSYSHWDSFASDAPPNASRYVCKKDSLYRSGRA